MPLPVSADEWSARYLKALHAGSPSHALAVPIAAAWTRDKRLWTSLPETAAVNIRVLSKLLQVSSCDLTRFAARSPSLFYQKPATVHARVVGLADLFGLTPQRYLAAFGRDGTALNLNPEPLKARFETCAALLGVSLSDYCKLCIKQPTLITTAPETLTRRIEDSSQALELASPEFLKMALTAPALLVRKPEALREFLHNTAERLGLSHDEMRKILKRQPQLSTQKPATLHGNVQALAHLIETDASVIARAAVSFPPILYLKPDRIAQTMQTAADALRIPRAEMVAAMLRIPSLCAREPLAVAHKVRLAVRIATAKGASVSASDVLLRCPAIPTYALDRLLIRWLIVRLGLWSWGWESLIVRSDRNCRALLVDYAASLPEERRSRLERILARRMKENAAP